MTLEQRYKEWIETWCSKNRAYGNCEPAVLALLQAFPELKHVRGHVWTTWGKRAHNWAITSDGNIVDPTASQFEAIFEYEPWKPGDLVRVGKCMNCGDEIWRTTESLDKAIKQECICSDICKNEFELYLQGEAKSWKL